MENDVLVKLEEGVTINKLNQIEQRLVGVETSLNDLISNQDEMKEELKDKLEHVKIEMEKNTSQVQRLQRTHRKAQMNSRYLFCSILFGLVVWTVLMNWLKISTL
tara:strand:- start:701 stop:1015 length:315 start_codon:yes stop_codon:yes gene_type:complete